MRPKTVRICGGDISHDETLAGQDEFDVQADIAPELFGNLLELLNQLVTKLRSAIASPAAPYSTVHVAIAHPCVPEGVASRDAVRGVQRPSNENTNGLLRQYFPKGTDLSRWTFEELQAVVATLNARPRKSLGWRTPAEVYQKNLDSLAQAGVASTP